MEKKKIFSLLTMCRKAGRLVMGFDPSAEAIAKGKATSIMLACDISPKTEKEIRFLAGKKNIDVIRSDIPMEEIGSETGKKAGIITVCDSGFSGRLAELLSE